MAVAVLEFCMYILYLDESGCTGTLPAATSNVQPVFILAGVIIEQTRLQVLTSEFLHLKQRFFPGLLPRDTEYLNWVLAEIKGAELRKQLWKGTRRERRHALVFFHNLLLLFEQHSLRVVGRVWIKGIGAPFKGRSVYTYSVQSCCQSLESFLSGEKSDGVIIADFRFRNQNSVVSHSVFTQKFMAAGDQYAHLAEMPVFGHSNNHVGIQMADLLCSGLLFPMAVQTYCTGYVSNMHVHHEYAILKDRFGHRLSKLQHRYQREDGQWTGGIVVSDGIAGRSGAALMR